MVIKQIALITVRFINKIIIFSDINIWFIFTIVKTVGNGHKYIVKKKQNLVVSIFRNISFHDVK